MAFKELLKDSGITQQELAIRLNISQAAISKWINHKVIPRTRNIVQLAGILNLDKMVLLQTFYN